MAFTLKGEADIDQKHSFEYANLLHVYSAIADLCAEKVGKEDKGFLVERLQQTGLSIVWLVEKKSASRLR